MTDPTPAAVPGAPPPAGAPVAPAAPFSHTGRVRELLAIGALNLLFKVLTLGIYHFWAKTRVRRYVWSHTAFFGEAFDYTGRPRELLLGYLLAMGVLLPLIVGLNGVQFLAERWPWLPIAASLLAYPVFVFLTGLASFSARRYLLSRTRWRSIRFALTGRARDHGAKMLLYSLLTAITFGMYLPFMRNRLTAHLVGHAWFGSEPFRYTGPDDVLLRRFLAAGGLMLGVTMASGLATVGAFMVLSRGLGSDDAAAILPLLVGVLSAVFLLLGLGIVWLWYRAGELRHFVGHTQLGAVRFSLDLSTARYVRLYLGNLAALVFTLGLAYPWIVVRTARTLTAALRMDGALDLAAIQQAAAAGPRVGEGLADALDLGSI